MIKIHFLGGAGTVTGSKTLIEAKGKRILIDCGMFQGIKPLRELNWEPLPILPSTIDFVLLTHGHLDHCGWLPRFVNQGFRGKIYCTAPTKEIAKLIMADSAKIQEEDAERANENHFSKHVVAEPLYTVEQAEQVTPLFRIISVNEEVALDAEITAQFFPAGHIIGACSISVNAGGTILLFSGDVGRDNDDLMLPPVKPQAADYVLLESTYGNRLHPETDPLIQLEAYVNNTIRKGGNVIIPSFAVERAQSIMFLLWRLKKEGRIPDVPYILDTPMGISVLQIFSDYPKWHKAKLHEIREMTEMFRLVSKYEDTIETIYDEQPKVIIAASGMITGGRVLSYLERYIGKPETTIIIVGFQAEGTRGRKLLEGAAEIKMHGKYYNVQANVVELTGLSAHGDQKDLLNWLSELKDPPKHVYLVHGENKAADELRIKINERYGYQTSAPLLNQVVELEEKI